MSKYYLFKGVSFRRHLSCVFFAMLTVQTIAQSDFLEIDPYITELSDEISYQLPYDVDMKSLERIGNLEQNLPEAQRVFDRFSWQSFIALNWPANEDGTPNKNTNMRDNISPRVWESYYPTGKVFLPDGGRPSISNQRSERVRNLAQSSKIENSNHTSKQLLDESLQAFTGPLIDQNGKWVFYEVLMNETEFNYILKNELYNQEGQAAYLENNVINFPANDGRERHGSIELKFAWKVMSESDIEQRFFCINANVSYPQFDDKGKPIAAKVIKEKVGLVGMHIATRTASAPQWIWSTFEQVDNLRANQLHKGINGNGQETRLKPNFNNPHLPTKAINTLAPKNAGPVTNSDGSTSYTTWDPAKTTSPTQAQRVVPLTKETEELNRKMQAALAAQGSVFQYYELIGTQWPLASKFPAVPGGVIHYDGAPSNGATSTPESLIYKAPGKMVPVLLTNMTMETFFQQGNQTGGNPERDARLPSNLGNAAQDPTPSIFYTESCVGCHYSAGAVIGFKRNADGYLLRDLNGYKVPIYGENSNFGQTGSGHFSWLLQMKARQKEAPIKN